MYIRSIKTFICFYLTCCPQEAGCLCTTNKWWIYLNLLLQKPLTIFLQKIVILNILNWISLLLFTFHCFYLNWSLWRLFVFRRWHTCWHLICEFYWLGRLSLWYKSWRLELNEICEHLFWRILLSWFIFIIYFMKIYFYTLLVNFLRIVTKIWRVFKDFLPWLRIISIWK